MVGGGGVHLGGWNFYVICWDRGGGLEINNPCGSGGDVSFL